MSLVDNPSVSVIVLAYNARKTIQRSLDSIIGQSFKNFELVVIDDGSTDDTGDLVDSYALIDTRIKVIHQNNAGVAISRQKGIDWASGIYSIFVDADDWIEPTMLEDLYNRALETDADIVFCDFMEYNGLGTFYRKQEPCNSDSRLVMRQMLTELHGSLWNKLVRRSLFQEKSIRFLEGLNYCEDEYVICRLLSQGIHVAYVGKALYHYDKLSNIQSISNDWKARPVEEYDLFLRHIKPLFNSPELKRNYNNRVGAILKKLTYAPDSEYPKAKTLFFQQFKSFIHSNLPWTKKAFCILFYSGLRKPLGIIREHLLAS